MLMFAYFVSGTVPKTYVCIILFNLHNNTIKNIVSFILAPKTVISNSFEVPQTVNGRVRI